MNELTCASVILSVIENSRVLVLPGLPALRVNKLYVPDRHYSADADAWDNLFSHYPRAEHEVYNGPLLGMTDLDVRGRMTYVTPAGMTHFIVT